MGLSVLDGPKVVPNGPSVPKCLSGPKVVSKSKLGLPKVQWGVR